MKNFNFSRKAQGFSLIELLLVLAIIAALAVAAFIIYPRVQAGRQATYESQVLSSAQAGIKALYTTGNFDGVNATVSNQADFFPDSMQTSATVITNQFNGAVTLIHATVAGTGVPTAVAAATAAPFFMITYPSVPTEVCIKLAASAANNFNGVLVGGVTATDVVKNASTGAVTVSTIPARCSSAAAVTMTLVSN